MATRKYNQFCAAAKALDLLGERWTLLLIRELLVGPKRYTDLLNALPGMGTNLLADRLKALEAAAVIRQAELPPPAASKVYELTERGRELEALIVELARWGLPLLTERGPDEAWRPEWSILAMQATFRPGEAAGVEEEYAFVVDGEAFHARVEDGSVSTGMGTGRDPAMILNTDAETFLAVANGTMSIEEAVATGRFEIAGDPEALERCARIFSLPAAAGADE